MRTNNKIALCVVLALSGLYAACGSDDTNPQPNPVGPATVGSGGATSTGANMPTSTASGGGASTTGSMTTTTTSGGGNGGAGGSGGCFKGTPATNLEFLNACTDADCAPFTGTLPLLNPDGSLPPLP